MLCLGEGVLRVILSMVTSITRRRRSSSGSEELRAWRGSTRGGLVASVGGSGCGGSGGGGRCREILPERSSRAKNRAAVMWVALGAHGIEGVEWLCCAQGRGRGVVCL